MDTDNAVIQLCILGTQAEFRGEIQQARDYYQQAWETARTDYEACIAAHYLARGQENPQEALRWNEEALRRADACQRASAKTALGEEGRSVADFLPSLYLSMGQSYERLGNQSEAQHYYEIAAALGFPHDPKHPLA